MDDTSREWKYLAKMATGEVTRLTEIVARQARAIEVMRTALRYNRNEMHYRMDQIENGWNIHMTGEMHTAIKMADDALAEAEKILGEG